MTLAANAALTTLLRGVKAYTATGSTTFYAGALVGLQTTTGLVVNWTDTAGLRLLGVVEAEFPLTGYGLLATVPTEVQVNESGVTIVAKAVTGVSAQTDVGKLVYASANDTFTLTPTTNVDAVGRITRWYSSTSCDIELFTPAEYLLQ